MSENGDKSGLLRWLAFGAVIFMQLLALGAVVAAMVFAEEESVASGPFFFAGLAGLASAALALSSSRKIVRWLFCVPQILLAALWFYMAYVFTAGW